MITQQLLSEAPRLVLRAMKRGEITTRAPARLKSQAIQLLCMRRLRAERRGEDTSLFPPRVRKQKGGDDWFETWTGRKFWPLRPAGSDVDMEDIAHALSLTNRFNGHTRFPYSVGQHSLMVYRIVREARPDAGVILWRQALLHDAPEAYLGDMVKPLKRGLHEYRAAETRLWRVIARKYGVPQAMDPIVKWADMVALATERRDLRRPTLHRWVQIKDGIEPLAEMIEWRPPEDVEAEFLRTFDDLKEGEPEADGNQ